MRNNVAFIDEHNAVYPCGHNIVLHNIETREQQCISGLDSNLSEGITAMSLSPSRRFLAVAEKSEKATANIYDVTTLRKRKTLSYSDIGSAEFTCVSFSPDNKICLTQGGAPEWNLVAWLWEKTKIIGTLKASSQSGSRISQADFSPTDSSIVCVTGYGMIKFLKLAEGQFRQLPVPFKRDPPNFVCHTWLTDDRLIAATDLGELWLFENYEFRLVLSCATEENTPISSLCSYSKGFLCGCEDGTLQIYERSDDLREYYRCTKTFRIQNCTSNIGNMAVSPTEDNLICTIESNQMYLLNLVNTDILKEDTMHFELLSTSFHAPGPNGSRITGLDICVRKPLIVTCGLDYTVRVWNYLEKTTELIKTFKEEAFSVAFHPTGFHILVGLNDKLRFMNLLMDDIRAVKEIPIKNCTAVRFSHGGQYFVAANNNSVQVYTTYSNVMIASLRGHTNRVTSIAWKPDDKKLVTCGLDGSIFTWQIKTGQKDADAFMAPRSQFHGVVVTNDMTSMFVTSSGRHLKEIDMATGLIKNDIETRAQLGPIELSASQKILFCGTIDSKRPGSIRAYRLPLASPVPDYVDLPCHGGPVTQLRLSNDNQYLFSTGADGSLCMFETKELQNRNQARGRDREGPIQFAEEILITRSDLEEKTQKMQELKTQVDELTLHNEYQLRLKDMNYKEKFKEISEKFTAELQQDRARFFELRDEKRDMELEYEDKLSDLEQRRQKEIEDLETSYANKIQAESDRYRALLQDRDEQNAVWEEENQLLVENHTQYLGEMTSEYDEKVEHEQKLQLNLSKEKDGMSVEFEQGQSQLEEDADVEIEDFKAKYEVKLTAEREATLRLKGENGIMKKKFSALQKDIEDQREEIRSLEEKEKELIENIRGLEKDIHGHKKEIREREETIQDKEKRIYDLKKKNQELEKFKFVLDYKIKELKRQIEPRENEIADMRQQIEEMDQELEQYHRSNAALDLMIGELRLKMEGMQKELDVQKAELRQGERMIHQFQVDLHECYQDITQGTKRPKPEIIRLYKKYVQDQFSITAASRRTENADQQENNRQREYLEKSVESLKRKIAKDLKMQQNEGHRLMRENAALTKESNQLRRDYHSYSQEQKQLQSQGKAFVQAKERPNPDKWALIEQQKEQIQALEKKLEELQRLHAGPLGLNPEIRPAAATTTALLPPQIDA